jgi:DNA-binding NtrC family response regulator
MKRHKKILIVDDEPNIRKILQAAFERAGYQTQAAIDGQEAIQILKTQSFDLLITDVVMPEMTGVELLKAAKTIAPQMPVVIMTAYGTIAQAVEAMRAGATDYVTKPFDLAALKRSIATLISTHKSNTKPLSESNSAFDRIIAQSPAMIEVIELVKRVADSRANVLVTGESGTGKEVIAKTLHKASSRSVHPFIAVSCAAIPETLIEAELFGYEKGAFTGADSPKVGRFELANHGTLFLDEIGELSGAMQVKLLRVLQERVFERLGGHSPIEVDVRLIAATNRDLKQAVTQGVFREDLLFRLEVLHIELPPLRNRPEDIKPLALQFIEQYAPINHRKVTGLSADALASLQAYSWPGNVRELENVIERAIVLASKDTTEITPELLPKHLRDAA